MGVFIGLLKVIDSSYGPTINFGLYGLFIRLIGCYLTTYYSYSIYVSI